MGCARLGRRRLRTRNQKRGDFSNGSFLRVNYFYSSIGNVWLYRGEADKYAALLDEQFALAILAECDGKRQIAARCVEAMTSSNMLAQANETCGARRYERSEKGTNGRKGQAS